MSKRNSTCRLHSVKALLLRKQRKVCTRHVCHGQVAEWTFPLVRCSSRYIWPCVSYIYRNYQVRTLSSCFSLGRRSCATFRTTAPCFDKQNSAQWPLLHWWLSRQVPVWCHKIRRNRMVMYGYRWPPKGQRRCLILIGKLKHLFSIWRRWVRKWDTDETE